MFGRLEDIVQRAEALSMLQGFAFVMSVSSNQEFVIELNTKYQLFAGFDADGWKLERVGGNYHPYTVMVKQATGRPSDRVTLFQTGEFYRSFKTRLDADGIVIEADTIKEGVDLRKRGGDAIIGLSDESIEKLADRIAGDFVNYLIKMLLDGKSA